MKYKSVHKIHEPLSAVGLGCWAFSGNEYWTGSDDNKSVAIIHAALDAGINLLDVAPVYGKGHAESVVGKALRGRERAAVIVASKCGLLWDDQGREFTCLKKNSVLKEIDQSLARLGLEHIDIYQLHWPDPLTPIDETLEAISAIKKAGKIRYFGVTNFSTEDVDYMNAMVGVDTQQGLYNMLERNPRIYHGLKLVYRTERETLPQCRELGQAFFPYSPFMQGLLAGAFPLNQTPDWRDVRRFNPKLNGKRSEAYFAAARSLQAIAERHDKRLNELAMNWLIRNPAVTSVIGSALSPKEVAANIKALEWEITPGMIGEIDAIIAPFADV